MYVISDPQLRPLIRDVHTQKVCPMRRSKRQGAGIYICVLGVTTS